MLGLVSHVADVAPIGMPYIGERSWAGSSRSSRTHSRRPARWSSWRTRSAVAGGRPMAGPRRAPAVMLHRRRWSWPRWTALKGSRYANPADRRERYQ